jgi:hypothetical protein
METGACHALPEKLQDSLLAVANKNGNESRKQFTTLLKRQHTTCAEKAANTIAMELQSTERDLIKYPIRIKNISPNVVGKLFSRR